MRATVVYESMFGNTHVIAEHIAEGLRATHEVTLLPVHEATAEALHGVDLLVVGGPTHVHGLTRPSTRQSAVETAAKPDSDLTLDPDAEGEGLREWFDDLGELTGLDAAAFDTRMGSVSALMSGRASKGIAKRLHRHGLRVVVDPESFLVDKDNHLIDGEAERATAWGEALGRSAAG